MATIFRKSPPICLLISITQLLSRALRFSKQYSGSEVLSDNEQRFTIFRHISKVSKQKSKETIVFMVRFKFARLSHKANKKASIIPMLLITGFPGFHTKMYAVNHENGYWQGMYEWKSKQQLEDYKKSFVYRMMNKRAIPESISEFEFENKKLLDFIVTHSKSTE